MMVARLLLLLVLSLSVAAQADVAEVSFKEIKTSDATYTAGAGSNRIILSTIGSDSDAGAGDPTFGGVGMTDVGTDGFAGTDGTKNYTQRLLEAVIPVGAQTFAITVTNSTWATEAWGGYIFTLSGVDQTTPLVINQVSQSPATTWNFGSVVSQTGGICYAFAVSSTGVSDSADESWGSGFVDLDFLGTGGGFVRIASKVITAGSATETASRDWGATQEGGASALICVNPAAATTTPLRRRRSN